MVFWYKIKMLLLIVKRNCSWYNVDTEGNGFAFCGKKMPIGDFPA